MVLFLAILAFNVNAIVVTPITTFGPNAPAFGGTGTEASNPDEDFNSVVTQAISFTTDTNVTVDNINVVPEGGFTNLDLNITLTAPSAIDTSTGGSLTFRARIPENLDAVNQNFDEVAFKVATLQLKSGATVVGTFDVFMQRENNLVISDANILINGASEGLDDGDEVKDIKPGDTIEVELELENDFSDRNEINVKIEDVTATVIIDQGDLDIDEDIDIDDIRAEDKETVTLNFEVDDDADEDDYRMEITAEGTDEHGAMHGEKWLVDLEVQRDAHDVQIKRIQVIDTTPPTLTCGEEVRFVVLVENEGTDNERNVFVQVEQVELGINVRSDPFELEDFDSRDNDATVTLTARIPEDAVKGNYIGQVKSIFNGGKDENSEFVQINLGECGEAAPVTGQVSLQLAQTTFTASQGSVFAVPVTLQNTGTQTTTYSVEFRPDTNWADTPAAQQVSVNAGESLTVYGYLTPRADLQSGAYTATLSVKQNGNTLATSRVTANVGQVGPTGGAVFQPSVTLESVWRNLAGSTAFWIAAIVVVVALIIYILTVLVRPK